MRIKYVGPTEGVEVPAAGLYCENSVPVEMPDELAQDLVKQGLFVIVKQTDSNKKAEKA